MTLSVFSTLFVLRCKIELEFHLTHNMTKWYNFIMKNQKHNLYTTQEVAGILKVHQRTIFRHIKNGKLKANKVLGHWRIKKEDLDKIIK